MKKILFMAACMISAAAFVSCGSKPKADLKTDVDTLSYAIGVANGAQMKGYLMQQGIDTAYIDDFIKGFNEGVEAAGDKKKAAYMLGLQTGRQMSEGINTSIFAGDSTEHVSYSNLTAGLIDGVKGKASIDPQIAMGLIEPLADKVHENVVAKRYKKEKEAGEKWMAENAKKEGVKTLPSGLQYKVITEGTGAIPTDSMTVKVHYEGKLTNDTVFDSSFDRDPMTVDLSREQAVIKGFREALLHMPVGSTWEVYIPQQLGYGARGMQSIPPFAPLVFKLQLLSAEQKQKTTIKPQTITVNPAQAQKK